MTRIAQLTGKLIAVALIAVASTFAFVGAVLSTLADLIMSLTED